jgi:hypothetical protein
MANPHHHSVSSARKYGGVPADYIKIHTWFDEAKEHLPDFRHRALRHHSQGIWEAERVFGSTITIHLTGPDELLLEPGATKQIPVRWIGEQHVTEDLGKIPTLADWFRCLKPEPWMNRARKLAQELEQEGTQ